MNSLTKKLPIAVSIFSAVSLLFVTLQQGVTIEGLKTELSQAISKLTQTQGLLVAEMALTEELKGTIALLEDSIEVMHVEMAELNEKIADQKATIDAQSQKIQKLEDNVTGLTQQISDLKKKGLTDGEQITKLQNDLDIALREMEIKDRERAKLMAENAKAEAQKIAEAERLNNLKAEKLEVENELKLETEAPRPKVEKPAPVAAPAPLTPTAKMETATIVNSIGQERIRQIATLTNVDFTFAELKMDKGEMPMEKLKKNGWKYTILGLNLTHPNADVIYDEEFIVQVFDLDNQRVVPMNEHNPLYSDSQQGSIGYKFTWENEPLIIEYFNSQKKTGSNYELRVFYTKDSSLFPLPNGTKRIVENGKVVI